MSYCDCDSDGIAAEFHRMWIVKRSRKEHRCDECYGPIFIGETYERQVGKWEGYLFDHNECATCQEIRQWAMISMPCFCAYEHGTLIERVEEMVGDVERDVEGFREEWDARRYQLRLRKMARPRE